MDAEQSLAIIKALADASRLAIVGSLVERPQYVEEIAKRHALAPSTVSFHVKKLEKAGLIRSRKEQYYVVVEANKPLLDTTLKDLVSVSPVLKDMCEQRVDVYHRKVLDTFFRHGLLERLPAQYKKRRIVLEEFVLHFEPGRRYQEAEVTGVIRPLFDDYCMIRRLLVDEQLLRREGTTYWRECVEGQGTQPRVTTGPSVPLAAKPAPSRRLMTVAPPRAGVYQLHNAVNGKLYIDSSVNVDGTRTSKLFQLKMGKAVFNRALQHDLKEHGASAFTFSVLEVLPEVTPEELLERRLLVLKTQWLERLQPFGDKGYNNRKGFERDQQTVAHYQAMQEDAQ